MNLRDHVNKNPPPKFISSENIKGILFITSPISLGFIDTSNKDLGTENARGADRRKCNPFLAKGVSSKRRINRLGATSFPLYEAARPSFEIRTSESSNG